MDNHKDNYVIKFNLPIGVSYITFKCIDPPICFPHGLFFSWITGILEFRRGGTRPYIKSGGGDSTGNRDRKPLRIQQQMYVPPAQRK